MNEIKKKPKKWWIAVVVVLIAGVLVVPMAMMGAAQSSTQQEYRVFDVQEIDVTDEISANGQLKAADQAVQRIQNGLEIDRVCVDIGQVVARGDIVATLDTQSLYAVIDTLNVEIADLKEQLEKMDDNGIEKNGDTLRYEEIMDFFDEDVSDAKRYLERYNLLVEKEKKLRAANEYLGNNAVCAVADGVVSEIKIQDGMLIQSGGAGDYDMMTIDSNSYQFIAHFDELDISSIFAGQEAKVVLDAFPELEISAKIIGTSYLGETVDDRTQYDVTLKVENDPQFRLGMRGKANIVLETKKAAKALPLDAIEQDGQGLYILVEEEGKTKRIPITTGFSDGSIVEIDGDVQVGDRVVKVVQAEQKGGMASFLPPMPGGM